MFLDLNPGPAEYTAIFLITLFILDTNHVDGLFSTRGPQVANQYYEMGSSLNTKKHNSLSLSGI